MANIIKPKRSNTAAKVPTTTELISGELGVNMADRKVYINNGTAVVQVGAGNLSGLGDVTVTSPINGQSLKYNSTTTKWENSTAGAGDVVGPASATDNALVRFDGTTGKLIQNSLGVLDDSGNLDVTSAKADYFDLDTAAAAPASAVGREAWDDGSGAPIVGLKGGVVTYYYGQQEFARVYNGSGAALTKGQVVYIVGAQGNRIDVRLAQANAESTSANTIGLVAEPIAIGAEGWVQTTGPLPKLDTSTLTAGQTIYLSPTTAGAYTTTKPVAPNHLVVLGFVERISATAGSIFLKIDNGYELDELHNVNISSPTGGQLLAYDQTAGYWKNITLTDGTGVSITETTAGAVTIGLATAYGDTLNPYASKTANNFLAAPNGAAGVPTFRAIVAADIPTLNQNTTGTAANVTGTVAIANGGTGQTTRQNAMDALAGAVTSGQYLRGNGTDVVMSAIQAADVPTLNQNTTGTAANVTGTVAIANGGTGATAAATALTNLGAYRATNPNGYITTPFPVGTVMLFAQTAAPTGWTKLTTHDNKALRVVSGTASSGGSVAFTTAFASQAVSGSNSSTTVTGTVNGTTLSTGQMPSHNHGLTQGPYTGGGNYTPPGSSNQYGTNAFTDSTGGNGSHDHGFSGGSHTHTFSGTAINLAVQYVDVIMASKA